MSNQSTYLMSTDAQGILFVQAALKGVTTLCFSQLIQHAMNDESPEEELLDLFTCHRDVSW